MKRKAIIGLRTSRDAISDNFVTKCYTTTARYLFRDMYVKFCFQSFAKVSLASCQLAAGGWRGAPRRTSGRRIKGIACKHIGADESDKMLVSEVLRAYPMHPRPQLPWSWKITKCSSLWLQSMQFWETGISLLSRSVFFAELNK